MNAKSTDCSTRLLRVEHDIRVGTRIQERWAGNYSNHFTSNQRPNLLTALADNRSAMFLWSYLLTNLRTLTSRQYRDAYLPLLFTDPELVERT